MSASITEIRRVGLEFDVYGVIDGTSEYIGTRRSESDAERLAASWRLEQAELASVVYARPAEPESEPVYVATPEEIHALGWEMGVEAGRLLADEIDAFIGVTIPGLDAPAALEIYGRAYLRALIQGYRTTLRQLLRDRADIAVDQRRLAARPWRSDPSLICPGCGRETYVVFNKSNCPSCSGW